eukprot:NODE_672_length_4853_cov_0.171855.p2 type:complete len:137 gc:universal NODE_672_length_4853_cov_0.171855:2274-2684(+)
MKSFYITEESQNYHPNIRTIKDKANWDTVHRYLHKNLESCHIDDGIHCICKCKLAQGEVYRRALQQDNCTDAFSVIVEHDPKTAVCQGHLIMSNLKNVFNMRDNTFGNQYHGQQYTFNVQLVPAGLKEVIKDGLLS